MSDRAPVTVQIYTCPDQKTANTVLGLFDEYGIPHDNRLVLGETYLNKAMSIGDDEYLADALHGAGVIYSVHQDTKYEYDGTIRLGSPAWGQYQGLASQDSHVLVTSKGLDAALDACDNIADLREAYTTLGAMIIGMTGRTWRDDIAQLAKEVKANPVTWGYDPDLEEDE